MFEVGDIVEIFGASFWPEWDGFRATVVDGNSTLGTFLEPLSDRPDGYYRHGFYWPTDQLRKI